MFFNELALKSCVMNMHFNPIPEVNSVIMLVFYLCISINNILTLFIMTRPGHAGQEMYTCILIN